MKNLIDRAKFLVKQITDNNKQVSAWQYEIAEIALELCDIRHGGRSKDIYTLKKFSNEIGVNGKSLSEWIAIYNIVGKNLDDDQKKKLKTPEGWANGRKTLNVLSEKAREDNREKNTPKKKYGRGNCARKKDIQNLYRNLEDEKPFHYEFMQMLKTIKTYRQRLEKRDLGLIQDSSLIEYMENLDKSSDFINSHLTRKIKKSA